MNKVCKIYILVAPPGVKDVEYDGRNSLDNYLRGGQVMILIELNILDITYNISVNSMVYKNMSPIKYMQVWVKLFNIISYIFYSHLDIPVVE